MFKKYVKTLSRVKCKMHDSYLLPWPLASGWYWLLTFFNLRTIPVGLVVKYTWYIKVVSSYGIVVDNDLINTSSFHIGKKRKTGIRENIFELMMVVISTSTSESLVSSGVDSLRASSDLQKLIICSVRPFCSSSLSFCVLVCLLDQQSRSAWSLAVFFSFSCFLFFQHFQ